MRTQIYVLSGPDGRIRYVGKTTQSLGSRLSEHLCDKRPGIKTAWIRGLRSAPTIDLVETVQGDGSKEERDLINGLLELGFSLVNGSKASAGRPSKGLTQDKVLVTGPKLLLGAAKLAAMAEGVSEREWWRRAARVRLGWHEVVPPSKTGSGEDSEAE